MPRKTLHSEGQLSTQHMVEEYKIPHRYYSPEKPVDKHPIQSIEIKEKNTVITEWKYIELTWQVSGHDADPINIPSNTARIKHE